uniref:Uncharacterized protein n=1 Tax=Bursaphelenchus xylophilus TaxID=6326 RepID=A0A1I7RLD4_BURXY
MGHDMECCAYSIIKICPDRPVVPKISFRRVLPQVPGRKHFRSKSGFPNVCERNLCISDVLHVGMRLLREEMGAFKHIEKKRPPELQFHVIIGRWGTESESRGNPPLSGGEQSPPSKRAHPMRRDGDGAREYGEIGEPGRFFLWFFCVSPGSVGFFSLS